MVAQKSEYQERPGERKLLHYRLTSEEWLRACRELKPSEKDVLYYLRTLDPFGEREIDIGVRHIARELEVSPSTVSRALKGLDAKGWIDLEILSARVKLHSRHPVENEVLRTGNTVASPQQQRSPCNNSDRHATLEGKIGEPVENPQPLQDKDSSDSEFSTECTRSVLKTFKTKQTGVPQPETVEINKKGLGTLLGNIESSGISVNSAILATVEVLHAADSENAGIRVRNAISAFREQEKVRNPQAFLNAALKKGFTSNEAKQRSSQNSKIRSKNPIIPAPRDLSDLLLQIDLECSRLGLTRNEAVERVSQIYGWEPKSFDCLLEGDLEILHVAMQQWS